jgi:DNA-binding IclR family transcriptional regulator
MTDVDADPDRYRAPALDKGLDIIELLAATPVGLTQGEIARQLQRTSSEIFRMLFVLRQRGYVAQADDDRYVLTTKLFKVADRHSPIRRLTAVAGQVMQTLANQINQSIHMSILQSGRLLVAALVDPPGSLSDLGPSGGQHSDLRFGLGPRHCRFSERRRPVPSAGSGRPRSHGCPATLSGGPAGRS